MLTLFEQAKVTVRMPRVVLSFSLAFLLLIGVTVLSRLTYVKTLDHASRAEHSGNIIKLFDKIDVQLRSAEIFTPTYENSIAKNLYKIYKADMDSVLSTLSRLRTLVRGNRQQTIYADSLEIIIRPQLPVLRQKNMVEIILTEGMHRFQDLEQAHRIIRDGLALEEAQLAASKSVVSNANRLSNILALALSGLALLLFLGTFFSQFYLSRQSQWLEGFLESVLNTSQNGLVYCKALRRHKAITDFTVVYANRASRELLGAEPKTIIGKTWSQLEAFRSPQLFTACTDAVASGRETELEHSVKDGASERSFALSIARLKDGVTISFYENTEIKKTAQELKKNIAALELSNKELEEYAYAASHDLQEPLRKIKTFSGFLQERQSDRLDGKGREQLRKIVEATERMSLLIKDLLHFSGLRSMEAGFEPTDLNEILDNVLQDLEVLIAQTHTIVTHEKLPEIDAIPVQMHQLFYNLVNNSLKFAKRELPLHLDVGCKLVRGTEVRDVPGLAPETDYHEIIFSDNGIGFSQQYARQIFGLFKRLHDKNQYAGSGIGLALCKKVVVNHNGIIAANGKEGVGAQFYIYLPVRGDLKTGTARLENE